MLEKLKESLINAPIVKKGDYDYFVHPVTDGIPRVDNEVLLEISGAIKKRFNMDVDLIVCAEAMGIHLATALSIETGIPFVVVRKRQYGLPGEVAVHQATGYSQGQLYINGIKKGDRILFIDDVVSTGGTMKGILNALQKMEVEIVEVIAVIEKGQGKKIVEEGTGCTVKSLVKVDVVEGQVVLQEV